MLLRLAKNKRADIRERVYVSKIIASNFDKLPENVRNLLFIMADDEYTAEAVAKAVTDNFDKLPEDVRNELHKRLAKHGYNRG